MRIRASKLVYLPIGGALGVGLLVSALVLPQPQLAASTVCYGVCRSDAALSLSRSTITVGKEKLEEFRLKVSAATSGAGTPTGLVEVKAGTRLLCRFGLSHGTGHCSLGEKELAPGSYEIEAHYSGDAHLSPSTSNRKHLEVVKGDSDAALSLSKSTVTHGKESREEFEVKVTTTDAGAGEPTGSVEVKAGARLLCRFGLSHGTGHCSLGNKQLAPGSYEIEAHYSGDTDLSPSTSARKHLKVRKS